MSYIPPKPQDIILPERVQQIVDEWKRNDLDYYPKINPEDDLESLQEIGYEKLAKEKPDTAYELIRSIYRIRDSSKNEEYIIYKAEKYVKNNNDAEMKFATYYNTAQILEVTEVKEEGNVVNVIPRAKKMRYTTKWDPKEFEKIISRSKIRTITNCYIADASEFYDTKFVNLQETGRTGLIYNHDEFKTRTFIELLLINKTGANTLAEAYKKDSQPTPKVTK